MIKYYYLYTEINDYICWTTHSNNKTPNKNIIVVYENVPTKISIDDLHVDNHKNLIQYLKGLNLVP